MALIDFSLGDVGSVFKDIREAITGESIKDPGKAAEIELQLRQLEDAVRLGQLKVNEAESKHSSIFVAGWRPFIAWVGGLALVYQFLLYPILVWIWALAQAKGYIPLDLAVPPVIDAEALYPLLFGMLGVGAMRSYDKINRVDTKRIG